MVLSRGSQLLTGVRIRDIKSEQKWTADSGDTAVLSLAIVNLPVGVRPSKNLNSSLKSCSFGCHRFRRQRRRHRQWGQLLFVSQTLMLPHIISRPQVLSASAAGRSVRTRRQTQLPASTKRTRVDAECWRCRCRRYLRQPNEQPYYLFMILELYAFRFLSVACPWWKWLCWITCM